jgi:hypothetical protein
MPATRTFSDAGLALLWPDTAGSLPSAGQAPPNSPPRHRPALDPDGDLPVLGSVNVWLVIGWSIGGGELIPPGLRLGGRYAVSAEADWPAARVWR